jgi:hypothetical protein
VVSIVWFTECPSNDPLTRGDARDTVTKESLRVNDVCKIPLNRKESMSMLPFNSKTKEESGPLVTVPAIVPFPAMLVFVRSAETSTF